MRLLLAFLLIAPLLALGQEILTDTISIKSGDCIKYQINDDRRQAIIWTTGNQDIAIPGVTFGTDSLSVRSLSHKRFWVKTGELIGFIYEHTLI